MRYFFLFPSKDNRFDLMLTFIECDKSIAEEILGAMQDKFKNIEGFRFVPDLAEQLKSIK